jgi:hypothetical protein
MNTKAMKMLEEVHRHAEARGATLCLCNIVASPTRAGSASASGATAWSSSTPVLHAAWPARTGLDPTSIPRWFDPGRGLEPHSMRDCARPQTALHSCGGSAVQSRRVPGARAPAAGAP